MTVQERALMPDYLRLTALFGIVIVNVQYIAFSALQDFTEPAGETFADAFSLWLVNGLALLKTYGLFSFMFGVGLGFLMRSAAQRGLPFGQIYRNRMIGLMLLGIIHGCLFYPGDILVIYAITGSILYLCRNWPVRRLVRVGAGLLIAQPVIALPLLLVPWATSADIILLEKTIMTEAGFLKSVFFRSTGFAITVPFAMIVQGISVLGWFCLGLAAIKSGMIDNADHPLWLRTRRTCLLPGVLLSLLGAGMWQWGPAKYGMALTVIAAPVATLGYLGLIAALSRPPGHILSPVLAAGGSSLSIYLGQSIILTTLFSAYGSGLWSEVSRLTAITMAVLVTVLLIVAVSIWRAWGEPGPFEWVLRKITYFRVRV